MSGKLDIPWAQLAIEGIAIVVSILLAFAIDAWWDERRERAEETRLLTALGEEMAGNAETSANYEQRKATQAAEIRSLIDALDSAPSGALVELPNITLMSAFSSGTYGVRRSVYDTMVQSGQLRLIENSKLREKLARWPTVLEDAVENEWQVRDVWAPRITERLAKDVSLPQIWDSLSCDPDDFEGRCANRTSQVRSDTEVVTLMMMSHVFLLEAEKELGLFAEYTESLTEMIDAELQSRE